MSLTDNEMTLARFEAKRTADRTRVPQCIVEHTPSMFDRRKWRVEAIPRSTDRVLVRDIKPRARRPEFEEALILAYRQNELFREAVNVVGNLRDKDADGKARVLEDRQEFMLWLVDRVNQLDEHMLRETA